MLKVQSGNLHGLAPRDDQSQSGYVRLMGRWQRRVATRVGLVQQNGRWHQRVATRTGLAQPNECLRFRISEHVTPQVLLGEFEEFGLCKLHFLLFTYIGYHADCQISPPWKRPPT